MGGADGGRRETIAEDLRRTEEGEIVDDEKWWVEMGALGPGNGRAIGWEGDGDARRKETLEDGTIGEVWMDATGRKRNSRTREEEREEEKRRGP
jgi:hypothetical protein